MGEKVLGYHAVLAQLRSNSVIKVWLLESRNDARAEQVLAMADKQGVPVQLTGKHALDQLGEGGHHQGVVAECNSIKSLDEHACLAMLEGLNEVPMLLVLDGVQDPHNLGACLRTALAAGVHAVVIPKDKSVGITPTVAKVACGALGQVPMVTVTNLARFLDKLKGLGIWIYGTAEGGGQTIYQEDLTGPIALVMGAEGSGLRRLTKEKCDVLCHIPTCSDLSSLNVSVATGICLFEAMRQRLS